MEGRSGGAAVEGLLVSMRRTFAYQSRLQAQLPGELAMLMVAMVAMMAMTMMMMMMIMMTMMVMMMKISRGPPRTSYDFLSLPRTS